MTRDAEPDLLGLPVLDGAYLARQTFSDAALQRDLLTLFAAQCDRLGPEIGRAPPAAAAFAAHALRGAANAIGAARVGALAARVEEALGAGCDATVPVAALAAAIADVKAATAALLRAA